MHWIWPESFWKHFGWSGENKDSSVVETESMRANWTHRPRPTAPEEERLMSVFCCLSLLVELLEAFFFFLTLRIPFQPVQSAGSSRLCHMTQAEEEQPGLQLCLGVHWERQTQSDKTKHHPPSPLFLPAFTVLCLLAFLVAFVQVRCRVWD